ncbi:MAG: ABC transporter permease [Propionibacteriaceae bacterium]|nr:ABC transporter permease [Propionibacteriaceae bacterium]
MSEKPSAKTAPVVLPAPKEDNPWGVRAQGAIVKYGFIAVTILLFAYFAATQPAFRTSTMLLTMLKLASVTAILGLGMTFTMTVGGMDMSVGAQAGLAVQMSAMIMVFYNMTASTAVVFVILIGLCVGLVNAFLIVVCRVPDLLATLAMMFVIQGAGLIPVAGQSISSGMTMTNGHIAPGKVTASFRLINNGNVGPIPVPVIIMLVLFVVGWFILSRTKWGRIMYAVGANPTAVKLAGVRVGLYRGLAYVISGFLASIAGLIMVARIGQGDVTAGSTSLLEAVAVALVGTSVLAIGRPNPWGTLLGTVLIIIVVTGLSMMGQPYYIQDTAKGLVLLLALLFSYTLSRKPMRFVPATNITQFKEENDG